VTDRPRRSVSLRGQASLPALGIALLLLTATVVLTVGVADRARGDAVRPSESRHVARALSDRLVSPDGPLADRRNVLNRTRLDSLTATSLAAAYPVAADADVHVGVDGTTVAGDPGASGPTARRVVLVQNRTTRTITPAFTGSNAMTVPRRTRRVSLALQPPDDVAITRVRAGNRVLLANGTGLAGRFVVHVSRYETTRLRFEATGALPAGSVRATMRPATTTKATLEVTADA
jgi:hypothetical protein